MQQWGWKHCGASPKWLCHCISPSIIEIFRIPDRMYRAISNVRLRGTKRAHSRRDCCVHSVYFFYILYFGCGMKNVPTFCTKTPREPLINAACLKRCPIVADRRTKYVRVREQARKRQRKWDSERVRFIVLTEFISNVGMVLVSRCFACLFAMQKKNI